MDIFLDIAIVTIILFLIAGLIVWLVVKLVLFLVDLYDRTAHQVVMLKHRPRLWWQFHKKYRSYADPMLELDSLAIVDMTEEEFNRYYQRLCELRDRVMKSKISDSGALVTKGTARYKATVVPPNPRYDEVYEKGLEWLNKQ